MTHHDIVRLIQDQTVKTLRVFHVVTGMLTVFFHMTNL